MTNARDVLVTCMSRICSMHSVAQDCACRRSCFLDHTVRLNVSLPTVTKQALHQPSKGMK